MQLTQTTVYARSAHDRHTVDQHFRDLGRFRYNINSQRVLLLLTLVIICVSTVCSVCSVGLQIAKRGFPEKNAEYFSRTTSLSQNFRRTKIIEFLFNL